MHTDEDEGHSELHITTTDRPGLLTDIVNTLKDVSVNVISAEVRTGCQSRLTCAQQGSSSQPLHSGRIFLRACM